MVWEMLLLLSDCIWLGSAATWGYEAHNGPAIWQNQYPECAGTSQSPIDIDSEKVTFNSGLTMFELKGYDSTPNEASWEIFNNGQTVEVEISGQYEITDGGLTDVYQAKQFHFHLGINDHFGSEHTLNGQSFPMEMHIVHFAKKYKTLENALKHPAGIATLAFMFKIGHMNHTRFNQLITLLPSVRKQGERVVMRPEPLMSMLPANLNNYYRYEGSLTAPPCSEGVVWTVFQEQIEISTAQMEEIRSVLKQEGRTVRENSRPRQPLNGRVVYSSNSIHHTSLLVFSTNNFILWSTIIIGSVLLGLFWKQNNGPDLHES